MHRYRRDEVRGPPAACRCCTSSFIPCMLASLPACRELGGMCSSCTVYAAITPACSVCAAAALPACPAHWHQRVSTALCCTPPKKPFNFCPARPPPPALLRSYEADLLKWFDRLLIDLRKRIDANTVRLAADDNAPLPTEDVQRLDNMTQQMNDMLARAAVSAPRPSPSAPPRCRLVCSLGRAVRGARLAQICGLGSAQRRASLFPWPCQHHPPPPLLAQPLLPPPLPPSDTGRAGRRRRRAGGGDGGRPPQGGSRRVRAAGAGAGQRASGQEPQPTGARGGACAWSLLVPVPCGNGDLASSSCLVCAAHAIFAGPAPEWTAPLCLLVGPQL